MKKISMLAFVMALALGLSFAHAADKEVTLKGTLQCAKCSLKTASECANVLTVKEDGKDVNYAVADSDATKDLHKKICKGAKEGVSITGVVTEKDGAKTITPTKVKI